MATVASLGYSLNIVTVLVPPLLIVLSLSYSVHVVSEYHDISATCDSIQASAKTLQGVTLPVILTGATTGIGFLSLVLSPLSAIQEFGLFSVIGVLYATFFSLTFTPAILQLMHRLRGRALGRVRKETESGFDRMVSRIARFDTRYRMSIYVVTGFALVVSVLGMRNIDVGMEHISNFDRDLSVRRDFEAVNRELQGISTFYVVVSADYGDAYKEPENLKSIQELQAWLVGQPEIGSALSITDYVMQVNRALNGNDPAYHSIPEDQRLISQLFFIGSTDETERLVDSRFQITNIVVTTRVVDSDDVLELVGRINMRLQQLPEHLHARVTGYPILVNQVIDKIVRGQAQSVLTALVVVYFILAAMFLSFKVGFIALVPNLVPVVLYFGALGIFGVTLNPSTSLIAPMVLGIAIDDTIHYMARFNAFSKQNIGRKQAAEAALKVVGKPVTYTSIGLCLGFLVLTSSELRMQSQVGLMASVALLIAWFSDFFLTPALCSRLKIATIWDVLSMDLGARPQESFPLFKGLSNFQARIFARMMDMTHIEAGQRLIHKGEAGSEMFAVIDGKLQASIEADTGRVNLDAHERGDLVGEAGLFFAQRTADVDVVEDARLLRISRGSLKRLGSRYPRIATKVYRNLNEILATRLVHATARVR
jgi:predicted RND superfamily exporter protein